MNRTFLVVGLAIAMAAVPLTANAHHLSVGYEDAVGVSSAEDQGKSVPDDRREAGISESCEEVGDEVDPETASRAANQDPFCGELLYGADTPFTQTSPVDQDLRDPIGSFDVVSARWADAAITDCTPVCPASMTQPGGELVWDAIHTAGSTGPLNLTHEPDRARNESSSRRFQDYGTYLLGPHHAAEAQQATGAWEMNGWWMPGNDRAFVGFLEDGDGNRLGPEELEKIIQAEGTSLPSDASPRVCGMSPNVDLQGGGPGAACELEFEYVEPGDGETNFRNGYQDRCNSPTYVCGALAGPYWQSPGYISTLGSQDQYVVWHWVVGHAQSPCSGAIEPGIDFDPGTSKPYLAHDLDVFVPVTATTTGPRVSQVGAQEYAVDATLNLTSVALDATFDGLQAAANEADNVTENVTEAVTGLTPGAVDDAVNETNNEADNATDTAVDVVVDTSFLFLKNHRVEPNNAEPVGNLDDTSQQQINVERSLDGPCAGLNVPEQLDDPDTPQNENTVDPWVNLVEGEVWQNIFIGAAFNPVEFFGNADTNQDESNVPGPKSYSTVGQVGIFADINDDGDYDQEGSDDKYNGQEVFENGAYPMLYDMWAEDSTAPDNPQVDETGGCETVADQPFSKTMKEAGYGPNTGLVQAIYLREPSVWSDTLSNAVAVFDGGNNIYLQMSDAARDLWTEDLTRQANPLDAEVDEVVLNLKDYAASQGPGSADDVGVVQPGELFGRERDYDDQCDASTGGILSELSFTHSCQVDCTGDTIVTMYTFEVTGEQNGKLGDGGIIPIFSPNNRDFDFGANTQHTWIDVDPFDNDPDRNDDECSEPRHTGTGCNSVE